MATKPQKKVMEFPDVELVPDAWNKFERTLKTIAKAGPRHREPPKPAQRVKNKKKPA